MTKFIPLNKNPYFPTIKDRRSNGNSENMVSRLTIFRYMKAPYNYGFTACVRLVCFNSVTPYVVDRANWKLWVLDNVFNFIYSTETRRS